jgi:hypothetical protein
MISRYRNAGYPRYNRKVLHRLLIVIGLTLMSAACQRSIETKEHVRNDLMEYFSSKVGLDMKTLDVDVTKVNFVNHEAHATVSFHQKDDPSVNRGMVMLYTLTPKDGHWVVKNRADSQGRGLGNTSADQDLPAGHPPVQDLPPGHPSVDSAEPPRSADAPQGRKK